MYELCRRQIENGCKTESEREEMKKFLGCFMMTKQITPEQYMELSNMVNPITPLPVVTPVETTVIEPQA